jgi:hypothetical protein
MNPASMAKTVKRMVKENGVVCHWNRCAIVLNPRGKEIEGTDDTIPMSAKVLLFSQSDSPKNESISSVGLSADFTKYALMSPDIDMRKDDIITDNFGFNWRVGEFDYMAVGIKKVAKYAPLIRADGGVE